MFLFSLKEEIPSTWTLQTTTEHAEKLSSISLPRSDALTTDRSTETTSEIPTSEDAIEPEASSPHVEIATDLSTKIRSKTEFSTITSKSGNGKPLLICYPG